jgi:hypothetical protein
MKTTAISNIFRRNYEHYEGVYNIQVYLIRLVFLLTFLFVGTDSWTAIITHQGPWEYVRAVAFCVWAAYSTLAVLGLIHPLRMLPLMMFQMFYKIIWLIIVAYPLWSTDQLAGSPAAEMAKAFSWVILPMVAMPWGYFFKTYVLLKRNRKVEEADAERVYA